METWEKWVSRGEAIPARVPPTRPLGCTASAGGGQQFPGATRGPLDTRWTTSTSPGSLKGIIRPFELEEIYLFYYLIDAGEFSYSNDMH